MKTVVAELQGIGNVVRNSVVGTIAEPEKYSTRFRRP